MVKTEYEAMPSSALARWQGKRAAELDGLEAVQQALRDAGPQRMSTTQQVNHAWAMLLSSHFQGFCRDLHTEALDCLLQVTRPEKWQGALRLALLSNRALDRGSHEIEGTVVEDRGDLGVGGRRILRVHFKFDEYDERSFEVPAADLRPAA